MIKDKRDKAKLAYLIMFACVRNQFLQGCDVMTDDCVHKISSNTSRPKVNRT